MGGACLRGHCHHWPAGRAGRFATGGRQQSDLAHQPDASGPDARPHLLRAGRDADPIRISEHEEQSDAIPYSNPVAVAIGKSVGDRDRHCLGDAVSIAGRHGDAITVAERQRETFGLPLAEGPTSAGAFAVTDTSGRAPAFWLGMMNNWARWPAQSVALGMGAALLLSACASAAAGAKRPENQAHPMDRIVFVNDKDGNLNNADNDQSIYVMYGDGTGLRQLTPPSEVDGPAWSPDGHRIAFSCVTGTSSQICLMNADGSKMTRLTTSGSNSAPTWSPDGKQIAFMKQEGLLSIYVMNSDGSQQTWVGATRGKTARLAWSPNGKQIAFQDEEKGVARINVLSSGSSGISYGVSLTSGGDGDPAWSPDGKQLAFLKYTTSAQVYVSNSDGTAERAVTSGSSSHGWPTWAPDGTSLAFEGDGSGTLQVYVIGLDGSGQRLLSRLSGANYAPAWMGQTPDPCLIGTWRSVILRSTDQLDNQPVSVTGGAGLIATFSADGSVTRDYTNSTPLTGSLNGRPVVDTRRGTQTFRITTSGGVMTYVDRVTRGFMVKVTYGGQTVTWSTVAPSGQWPYTCSGTHLTYQDDDYARVK